jgi:hypothetical protein
MTMKKTLGQVAYEAYCEQTHWKSAISGADLPSFNVQKIEIQVAWEAAARAVERIVEDRPHGPYPPEQDE